MKIYDYHCSSCDLTEERFVKSYDETQKCLNCGEPMIRHFPAPGMVKTNFADKTGFKTRSK